MRAKKKVYFHAPPQESTPAPQTWSDAPDTNSKGKGKGDGKKKRSFQCMMGGLVVAGLDAGPNTVLP